MKRNWIVNGLISFGVTCIAVILLNFWTKGIPCIGLPNVDHITRVEITNTKFSDEPKVYTDAENIELARKVANFLSYKPGTADDMEEDEGYITIRYEKNDGEIVEISANETTVFWKGKAHELKDDKTFVNLVEGIFFLGEAVEKEGVEESVPGTAEETSSGTMSETSAETAPEVTPETIQETAQAGYEDRVRFRVLENLGAGSQLLTESYYQPGMQNMITFSMTGTDPESPLLSCIFYRRGEEELQYYTDAASAEIETDMGKTTYLIQPELSEMYWQENAGREAQENVTKENWQISFARNGEGNLIRVSGTGVFDGDYYSLEQMVSVPDMLERYLGPADLYPYTTEELRLLRNEIYAVYGAEFQSEDLRQYFGEKTWYDGQIPTSQFPEGLLTDVQKANIALMKELENLGGLVIDGKNYDSEFAALPDAPYLSWLDQYKETGLHVDMREAVDKGLYYVVSGEISIPVTITKEQMELLEQGQEIQIVINEITGESRMICRMSDSEPGARCYWYYKPGSQPDQYALDINASLDAEHGVYTLWCFSDDTIVKTVYEGDIYILKGAVHGAHVSLLLASMDQRELKIPDSDNDVWNMEVFGNYLCHDGRGYITAVYGLGD